MSMKYKIKLTLGLSYGHNKNVLTGARALESLMKGAILGLFLFIFGLFKQTIQNLQQINVKNDHPVSSNRIQTHDIVIMSLLL